MEEAGQAMALGRGRDELFWGEEAGCSRKEASRDGGPGTRHMQFVELWGHQERRQMSGARGDQEGSSRNGSDHDGSSDGRAWA